MKRVPAIVVALHGGLGNQLFQYAAGKTVERQIGGQLFVRTLGSQGVQLDQILGTQLSEATPQILRRVAAKTPGSRLQSAAKRIRRRRLLRRGTVQHYGQTPAQAFASMPKELLDSRTENIYLDGYFQHPTWFQVSLTEVATLLSDRLDLITTPNLARGATVISFRRGDYVRLGWDLPIEYYEQAIETISATDGPVYVIGDDEILVALVEPWLKAKGIAASPLPDFGVARYLRDLVLLSTADQVIMSNSTFCWWGVNAVSSRAALSKRRVIAPAQWLPVAGSNLIVLPHWHAVGQMTQMAE